MRVAAKELIEISKKRNDRMDLKGIIFIMGLLVY
jgi:hypothetical protein